MRAKPSFNKKVRRIQRQAQGKKPTSNLAKDIGDWTLAQDADGNLIAHNTRTGARIVVAQA